MKTLQHLFLTASLILGLALPTLAATSVSADETTDLQITHVPEINLGTHDDDDSNQVQQEDFAVTDQDSATTADDTSFSVGSLLIDVNEVALEMDTPNVDNPEKYTIDYTAELKGGTLSITGLQVTDPEGNKLSTGKLTFTGLTANDESINLPDSISIEIGSDEGAVIAENITVASGNTPGDNSNGGNTPGDNGNGGNTPGDGGNTPTPIVTQADGTPITARGQEVNFAPTTNDETSNEYMVLQLASGFSGSAPVGMDWVADNDATAKYALIMAETAVNSSIVYNPSGSDAIYTGSTLESTINTWASTVLSGTYGDGVYTDYAQEVNLQGSAQDSPYDTTLTDQSNYATVVAAGTNTYAFAPSVYDVSYNYSGGTSSLLSTLSVWDGVTTEYTWLRSPFANVIGVGGLNYNGEMGGTAVYGTSAARPAFWVKIADPESNTPEPTPEPTETIVTQEDGTPVTARGQEVNFAPTTNDATSNEYMVLQLASGFSGSAPVGMNWVADNGATAKYALILAETAINSVQYNDEDNINSIYTGSNLETTINNWSSTVLSNTYGDGIYTDYAQEVNLQGAAQNSLHDTTLTDQSNYATVVAAGTNTYAFAPSVYDVFYDGGTNSLLTTVSVWNGFNNTWLRSPYEDFDFAGYLYGNGSLVGNSVVAPSGARPAFWVKIS